MNLLESLCSMLIILILVTLSLGPISRGGRHMKAQIESVFRFHGSQLDRASNLNLSSDENPFNLGDVNWP